MSQREDAPEVIEEHERRKAVTIKELLHESLEHIHGPISAFDLLECPECHQKVSAETMTRCDRCFIESVKRVLGIRERPF